MKRKYKLILMIIIAIGIFAGIGVTYSLFHSETPTNMNRNIAKFVFNSKMMDELNLSLNDIIPGQIKEYSFSISNNEEETISDVLVEYQISLKTYHFIPLEIELYKSTSEGDVLLFNCDETYSRNLNNEIVCNTEIQQLNHTNKESNNYKLIVEFPSEYNDITYSNLMDFLDLEINSWQKVN